MDLSRTGGLIRYSKTVGSTGVRLGLINPGERPDGLQREGSISLTYHQGFARVAKQANAPALKVGKVKVRVLPRAPSLLL